MDEVNAWNSQNRKPTVRLWPLHELEFQLWLRQEIARKYGLIATSSVPAVTMAKLALHVARTTQAASAALELGKTADRHVFAASCLAELLYVRSDDLERFGQFRKSSFLSQEVLPRFVSVHEGTDVKYLDRVGLRAMLACLHLITSEYLSLKSGTDTSLEITWDEAEKHHNIIDVELLKVVGIWSGMELSRAGCSLCLTPQILI